MFGLGAGRAKRGSRRFTAKLGVLALAAGVAGVLAGSVPAGAAQGTVTGATLEWGLNDEVALKAPPFGGCNFLSAGSSDGTQAQYRTTDGNVTVQYGGSQPTWATKCGFVSAATPQTFRITGGSGTLDPATGAATISFTGTVTANFYGGLAPFSFSDLVLTTNGSGGGQLTGTLFGWGSSQEDPNTKFPLDPVPNIVIATFSGVNGANTTGFTATPDYAGVLFEATGDIAPQNRTNPGWGAWPTSWINFHIEGGLSSYWYSSGGAADAFKAPRAVTVGYGTYTGPSEPTGPSTTVTPNANLDPTVENVLTVSGSGFTLPPGSQGVYVGLVSAADWQPGQTPNPDDFTAVFVPSALIPGGSFSNVQITVPANTADTTGSWGVGTFCAHACSLTNRTLDSFTSVTFSAGTPNPEPGEGDQSIVATIPELTPGGEFSWTIDAEDHTVFLSEAVNAGSYLHATGQLKPVKVTDTRTGGPAWSVSGQVGDFTGGLSGKYLGWTPVVTQAGAGATAGAQVDPGINSGNGLKDSSVLASATAGHATGTATFGAGLDLKVPVETPAGTYTATLTLTALS